MSRAAAAKSLKGPHRVLRRRHGGLIKKEPRPGTGRQGPDDPMPPHGSLHLAVRTAPTPPASQAFPLDLQGPDGPQGVTTLLRRTSSRTLSTRPGRASLRSSCGRLQFTVPSGIGASRTSPPHRRAGAGPLVQPTAAADLEDQSRLHRLQYPRQRPAPTLPAPWVRDLSHALPHAPLPKKSTHPLTEGRITHELPPSPAEPAGRGTVSPPCSMGAIPSLSASCRICAFWALSLPPHLALALASHTQAFAWEGLEGGSASSARTRASNGTDASLKVNI
jgi:hypothetical protein